MLNIDQEIFAENLLLTQIYCEEQLKNTHKSDAEVLRSINPIRNEEPVFKFTTYDKTKVSIDVTIDPLNMDFMKPYLKSNCF